MTLSPPPPYAEPRAAEASQMPTHKVLPSLMSCSFNAKLAYLPCGSFYFTLESKGHWNKAELLGRLHIVINKQAKTKSELPIAHAIDFPRNWS